MELTLGGAKICHCKRLFPAYNFNDQRSNGSKKKLSNCNTFGREGGNRNKVKIESIFSFIVDDGSADGINFRSTHRNQSNETHAENYFWNEQISAHHLFIKCRFFQHPFSAVWFNERWRWKEKFWKMFIRKKELYAILENWKYAEM